MSDRDDTLTFEEWQRFTAELVRVRGIGRLLAGPRRLRGRLACRFGRHDWQSNDGLLAVWREDPGRSYFPVVQVLGGRKCARCGLTVDSGVVDEYEAEAPPGTKRMKVSLDNGRTWVPVSGGDEGNTP